MRRTIRLTERDLSHIVRRVIREEEETDYCSKVGDNNERGGFMDFNRFMENVEDTLGKIKYIKTSCDFEKYALMTFRLKEIVDKEMGKFDTIDVNNLKNNLRQRYRGFIK